jgi:hypothetical protein
VQVHDTGYSGGKQLSLAVVLDITRSISPLLALAESRTHRKLYRGVLWVWELIGMLRLIGSPGGVAIENVFAARG